MNIGNVLETFYDRHWFRQDAEEISLREHSLRLRDHPVGWGGGNRYVEGDLLTFGYLILNDSLGYPYFRLFNGNP